MRAQRSTVAVVVVGVLLVAAAVWVVRPGGDGVPLDPRGTGQTGTAALLQVVERSGASVRVADVPGDADTIVILADRLADATREDVQRRVRDGARLVLLDPASPLNVLEVTGAESTDLLGVLGRAPACDLLDGVVDRVEAARWLAMTPPPNASERCFPVEAGAGFGLVAVPVGEGEALVTGAVDALVNRAIGDADHARFGVALLAPTGSEDVVVVWDATVGGDVELLDLLPDGVRTGLWLLAGAALLLVLMAGRRLGPPVPERLPVRVPASELVIGIGGLMGRHGHRREAAARLRDDLRVEVAAALDVPRDTPPDVLVELLADRLGGDVDVDGLRRSLLDGPVEDDEALVAVTAAMARVRGRLRATSQPRHGSPGE